MASPTRPKPTSADSEAGPYYRIYANLTYRVLDGTRVLRRGTGRTTTMSSNRVLLETETWLPADTLIELSLSWPVMLDNRIPLKLVILGRTIVFEGSIAVDILRHEFRTQAVHGEGSYPAATGKRTLSVSA